ncbi:MAG TPA: beta-N-acetylhexosaminidase [Candidatus Aquilonibacter sp.]|jgi:hexosaminidase|nr:beta-N-acetylhexosaminidase [Candidatus Aquilonibacter sp.]
MQKPYVFIYPLLILIFTATAQQIPLPINQPVDSPLKLIPQPKEVQVHQGSFHVTAATKILVAFGHQSEDRIAAETLAEEIRDQSGLKISIIGSKEKGKQQRSTIELARLQDRSVKVFLESRGLKSDSIGDQGYLLFSDALHLIVAANTGQGLFYGVQTLRQLLHLDDGQLICPGVSIRDWPTLAWRGVQDDISRGPIPTQDFMERQIRTLAAYKVNLFALYMEHVFDFASQPLVAPKEAALTPEEIKALVAYAKNLYVTILPEQQTFGHLHHMLKYEIYSDVAERPHGHVLTPTKERSYELIKEMYADLVPLFPGPFLHVGGDETFELGHGQTAARAAEVGLGRVYLEHLQKVNGILQPYHKELMFWGDIALKYPQLLTILPKDMIAVPWDYDPRPSYDNIIKPYRDAGLRVMVAPGANNWNQVWPDFDAAFVNIRNFVRDGENLGAIGMINTTWNDDGESIYGMTWPALVFGAAAGWQAGESDIEQFKNSYDWAFYRDSGTTVRDALENLDRNHKLLANLKISLETDELFWADPFTLEGAKLMQTMLPAAAEMRIGAEQALEILYRRNNKDKVHANKATLADIELGAWRWDTLGMKAQFTQEINHFYWDAYQNQTDAGRVDNDLAEITDTNARLEDLRDATTRLREMYRQAWLREYQPYWLDNVLIRYDVLAREFEKKIIDVRQVRREYEATKMLASPQDLGLYLRP